VHFPIGIVLKSDATGKEIPVRLGATFGCANLTFLDDPDIKYVALEQFKIEKRHDQGGWAVVNAAWAKNPLFLNGAFIDPTGVILKEGDQLSIKDKFFRLTVHILTN